MHEAALREMDRKIADSVPARAKFWHRDVSSPTAYEKSIAANRERFRQIIGLVDPRVRVTMERFGDEANPALVAETVAYRVWQVRWPALEGVHGEGLLLEPQGRALGYVVALPDADQTPEQIAGLAPGVPAESQFARRLAENGFGVIIPVLIDRSDAGSGNPAIAMTNQPHREWIHRQAYMMGRHVIGYEVQKVLAAVDWAESKGLPIGVAGYGEGGLVAFYAAAVDSRIKAALVSGYFKSRQQTWEEPLYRNVWGLLREFGDAEIATLLAPRGLVVESCAEPKVDGPPPVRDGRKNCAAPGKLTTPPFAEVEAEFARINELVLPSFQPRRLVREENGEQACAIFSSMLGAAAPMKLAEELPAERRVNLDPAARQMRQMKELEVPVQGLIRISDRVRNDFFLYKLLPEYRAEPWTLQLRFDSRAPETFVAAAKDYRRLFWEEVIGKLDEPLPAPNPRTRKIYDEPKWTGYEVVVDVGGEGFAWGIMCVPKDLKPGEKRPVVVCQHGRHGLPQDVITGDKPAYRNFAARLAEQGFITFAPHALFQKEAYYRTLSRKGNTVGLSMFSVIIRHHEQWLNWLGSLPFVDTKRIGFYGLSYGGEAAVRVPPLLDGYCLSICSGDFNDWPRKVASTDDKHSFMFTDEWEMPYFNMGNTFSYAELTYLMFPRPFMVERGHHDQVAPDEWVASEYAKTRWLYDQFGLGDRTAIEFFNGGHTINGQGTFDFLHKHLRWPKP
jgi:dienelactone hydrolase